MKVIFLDIDGPMIPGRQYGGKMGVQRRTGGGLIGYLFDPFCVRMVTHLATTAGAKIVWNTTHNLRGINQITEDAVASGLDPALFHPTAPQTIYPGEQSKFGQLSWGVSRLKAIQRWTESQRDLTHWVALDDEPIKSKNAILIDFQAGITSGHIDRAMLILGVDAPKLAVL